jgi:hypothetical protein
MTQRTMAITKRKENLTFYIKIIVKKPKASFFKIKAQEFAAMRCQRASFSLLFENNWQAVLPGPDEVLPPVEP